MATEKKQQETAGSIVSKNKNNDTQNAGKIKLRAKKKTGVKTKRQRKQVPVKIARHRNRNSVTVDDPSIQHLLLKPASRIVKDAEELRKLFNEYLATCIEKTKKAKLVPIKTENVLNENDGEIEPNNCGLDIDIERDIDNPTQKKKKGGRTTITNDLYSRYEIVEGQERGKIPTIWGFLIYLGGLSYQTWCNWRNNEALMETVGLIDSTLEEIRTEEAAKGNINPSIAALILNVKYNRIPKKEVDTNIKGSIFKESDFIDD